MPGPLQTGFQGLVNNQLAPAVAGDYCGANPRLSVLGGSTAYVAPASGLIVGNFCWVDQNANVISQSYVPGTEVAFLRRSNQAIIVNFLAPSTMFLNAGLPAMPYNEGDFYARFAGGATPGQSVYADAGTGAPIAGGASAPATVAITADAGFTGTAAMGASFTGVIATNVLTTSAQTGYITAGDVLVGAGVTAGTVIGAQLTGTPGAAGTYTVVHADVGSEAMTSTSNLLQVTATVRGALVIGSVVTGGTIAANSTVTSIPGGGFYTLSGAKQTVASGTKNANTTTLNVTAVATGPLEVGDILSGTGVSAGTQVVGQLTGTAGGIGTYQISISQNFASTAVASGAIPTQWKVNSVAAVGELAKISTWG